MAYEKPKPTREAAALAVSDIIQTCINTGTVFIMNHRPDVKTITITSKKDYDKFKALFKDANIEQDSYSACYSELKISYV
jgi:hypothetical protein